MLPNCTRSKFTGYVISYRERCKPNISDDVTTCVPHKLQVIKVLVFIKQNHGNLISSIVTHL